MIRGLFPDSIYLRAQRWAIVRQELLDEFHDYRSIVVESFFKCPFECLKINCQVFSIFRGLLPNELVEALLQLLLGGKVRVRKEFNVDLAREHIEILLHLAQLLLAIEDGFQATVTPSLQLLFVVVDVHQSHPRLQRFLTSQ